MAEAKKGIYYNALFIDRISQNNGDDAIDWVSLLAQNPWDEAEKEFLNKHILPAIQKAYQIPTVLLKCLAIHKPFLLFAKSQEQERYKQLEEAAFQSLHNQLTQLKDGQIQSPHEIFTLLHATQAFVQYNKPWFVLLDWLADWLPAFKSKRYEQCKEVLALREAILRDYPFAHDHVLQSLDRANADACLEMADKDPAINKLIASVPKLNQALLSKANPNQFLARLSSASNKGATQRDKQAATVFLNRNSVFQVTQCSAKDYLSKPQKSSSDALRKQVLIQQTAKRFGL